MTADKARRSVARALVYEREGEASWEDGSACLDCLRFGTEEIGKLVAEVGLEFERERMLESSG